MVNRYRHTGHLQLITTDFNRCGNTTVDRVKFQQIGQRLIVSQVIERNQLQVFRLALQLFPDHQPADSAGTIDSKSFHSCSPWFVFNSRQKMKI